MAFAAGGLLSEGVEDLDSGQLEVLDVAGDHGHAVYPRRCCNERVDHREGLRVLLTAPGSGDREGDRENPVLEPGLHIPEPALEGGSLVPVSPAANPSRSPARSRPGSARRRAAGPAAWPRSSRLRPPPAGACASPTARWCRAGRSRARLKIDRTPEVGLALALDLREDISGAVVELRTAEQDARKVHRRPGQPAILTDIYHYRDILTVPGDDLRPLAHNRTDHLAEALLGVLDLPVIRSR